MLFEGEEVRGERTIREEGREVVVAAVRRGKASPVYQCREHRLRAGVATVEFKLRNMPIKVKEGGCNEGIVKGDEADIQV